jgi:heme-degrading monooxygenase HmoA
MDNWLSSRRDEAKRVIEKKEEMAMKQIREMHARVNDLQQLSEDDGPVLLVNQFTMSDEDAEQFLAVWAEDAAFMKQQPGFISTQFHRGLGAGATFMNVAIWESAKALGNAFRSRAFQERAGRYPDSAVAVPQVYRRVAVTGICTA